VLIELYPDRYPRRKTPAEVNAMLQQYEQQLPSCRNETGELPTVFKHACQRLQIRSIARLLLKSDPNHSSVKVCESRMQAPTAFSLPMLPIS
jgi:hypothetical protein